MPIHDSCGWFIIYYQRSPSLFPSTLFLPRFHLEHWFLFWRHLGDKGFCSICGGSDAQMSEISTRIDSMTELVNADGVTPCPSFSVCITDGIDLCACRMHSKLFWCSRHFGKLPYQFRAMSRKWMDNGRWQGSMRRTSAWPPASRWGWARLYAWVPVTGLVLIIHCIYLLSEF